MIFSWVNLPLRAVQIMNAFQNDILPNFSNILAGTVPVWVFVEGCRLIILQSC
jgi:hypothetical protein